MDEYYPQGTYSPLGISGEKNRFFPGEFAYFLRE
jgi:hypothetical protein